MIQLLHNWLRVQWIYHETKLDLSSIDRFYLKGLPIRYVYVYNNPYTKDHPLLVLLPALVGALQAVPAALPSLALAAPLLLPLLLVDAVAVAGLGAAGFASPTLLGSRCPSLELLLVVYRTMSRCRDAPQWLGQ